jgi:hypothetical protein
VTKKFVVLNESGYPMHVHAAGCRDLSKPKYRGMDKDWILKGDINAAVSEATTDLNSQFDHQYKQDELFKVFPCCN